MSLFDVGDLIFDSLNQEGRLVCDGSQVSSLEYPKLTDILQDKDYDFSSLLNPILINKEYFNNPFGGYGTPTYIDPVFNHFVFPSNKNAIILDMATWDVVNKFDVKSTFNRVAISPDGNLIALTGYGTGSDVSIYTVHGEHVHTFWRGRSCSGMCFGPNSDTLYLLLKQEGIVEYGGPKWAGTGRVYSTQYEDNANAIVLSPDRKSLFIRGSTSKLNLDTWEAEKFMSHTVRGGDPWVFSPDGRYALAPSANGTSLIDLDIGTTGLHQYDRIQVGGSNIAYAGYFTPDGTHAIVICQDGIVVLQLDGEIWHVKETIEETRFADTKVFCGFTLDGDHFILKNNSGLNICPVKRTAAPGYLSLPDIPDNPHNPGIPVLIQVT